MSQAESSNSFNSDPTLLISKENSSHLITLTIKQIVKDFGLYGYTIKYSGAPEEAYDSISKQIRTIIEDRLKDGYGKLKEILYRIDVSEKTIHDSISSHPDIPAPKLISKLIMEREFKKVCSRANYGSE